MANTNLYPLPPSSDWGLRVRSVERPPTWRDQAYTLSYLMIDRQIDAGELVALLRWAANAGLPNPRIITPDLIRWSSLFHPRFYKSVSRDDSVQADQLAWVDKELPSDMLSLSRLWMQSVSFLSGVTLSAAIVQGRYSAGTIGSKLDRLWDAGKLADARVAPELTSLDICNQVSAIAADSSGDLNRLFQIRQLYMAVLRQIAPTLGVVEWMKRTSNSPFDDGRFDFVNDLNTKLGKTLRAVLVYGSSTSGNQFADIDAVLIVDDPVRVLEEFAGTSPEWHGKELNLGVYSPSEFLVMQYLSGDNLTDYGICIWGEVEVVRKPTSHLLARNFSFGVVRQRQQLGMLSREISSKNIDNDDRKNLYEYFVKIPANVAKGTFGAVGKRLPKEQIHQWLINATGFDAVASQKQVAQGSAVSSLAASALATGEILAKLNEELSVVC